MRMTYLTAALAASCLVGGVASLGPARADDGVQLAQTCASGYHADRGGNCQPDGGETNRYCPPGAVFHPSFDGWYCDSPSGRTYY
jgi:hypothetical protein